MRIRIGMVGGGQGAFIGAVHRIALRMDGAFDLVAGCFSSDPKNSAATGRELDLDPSRVYATYDEMAEKEAALPEDVRIQAVSIVTPNHVHAGPTLAFLKKGIHVICDKPLATSVETSLEMEAAVKASACVFALTHNYTGYPMVREARERVRGGSIGTVRKVYVEYLQGWLSEKLEETGQKQAAWRTDPKRSGPVGALGDIGTHAFNLLEHVTGLRVTSLYALLETFVDGRLLDDDDTLLLRLDNGASGTLTSSQVCFGRENGLKLRIFGTEGALEWDQEHPNDLIVTETDGSTRRIRTGTGATGATSKSLTRTPPGHPEGYLEGFANIYSAFAKKLRGEDDKEDAYPTVHDGRRGIQFISAALASNAQGTWVDMPSA